MRAKPIFTYSLLAGALALPGHALALGLGKLTVESALGQPLSARIELTSVTREDLDSLRGAGRGSRRSTGRTTSPTRARCRAPGSHVEGGERRAVSARHVAGLRPASRSSTCWSSSNWASGRVVREYTFLLDPPGLPAAAATEPVTPARAGTPARTARRTGAARAAHRHRRPLAAPRPAAPATAPSGGGDQYTVQARRYAAADRYAVQARRRDARADARRRCSAAIRARSKATT